MWTESEKELSVVSEALLDGTVLPKGHEVEQISESDDNVLDKIRAEIAEHADRLKDSLYGDGLRHAMEIIDKYRLEKENEKEPDEPDLEM